MSMGNPWIETAQRCLMQMPECKGINPPDDSDLKDLLANLMHWARYSGINFDVMLDGARKHYERECEMLAKVRQKAHETITKDD